MWYLRDPFPGSTGSGWTRAWTSSRATTGGSLTTQSGRGRINTGTLTGYSGHQTAWASGVNAVGNTEVLAKFRFASSGIDCALEIWTRSDRTAAFDGAGPGYIFQASIANGGHQILKSNGSYPTLGSPTTFTFVTNTDYWVRFQVLGTTTRTVQYKFWTDGSPEPGSWTQTVSDTDGVIGATGQVHLNTNGGGSASGLIDIDEVSIGDGGADSGMWGRRRFKKLTSYPASYVSTAPGGTRTISRPAPRRRKYGITSAPRRWMSSNVRQSWDYYDPPLGSNFSSPVDDVVGLTDSVLVEIGRGVAITDSTGITDSGAVSQNGFGTGTPAGLVQDADTTDVTLGTSFTVDQDCIVSKIRFYQPGTPANSGAGFIGALQGSYSGGFPTATIVQANFGTINANAWNEVAITPTSLTAGVTYCASVYFPGARYGATSGKFSTTPTVSGDLTFPNSTGTTHNGVFKYGSGLTIPDGEFGATWYGTDVEILVESPLITTALTSILAAAPVDSAGLTDTILVSINRGQALTDPVGLSDAVSTQAALSRTQTDVAGLTDALSAALGINQAPADTMGLSDSASTARGIGQAQADTAGLTDSTSLSRGIGQAPADTAGLVDSTSTAMGLGRAQTDSVGLTDSASPALNYSTLLTDTAGITDSMLVAIDRGINLADSAGITDSLTSASDHFVTVADSVGITDSANAALAGSGTVDLADSVGLTDSLAVAASRQVPISDTAGLTDAALTALGRGAVVTDSAGLTDALVLTRGASVADSAGLTDSISTSSARGAALADTAGLTDSVVVSLIRAVVIADNMGLTDSVAANIIKAFSLSDAAGLTDSILVRVTHEIVIADSVGLTDTVAPASQYNLTVLDDTGLTDVAIALLAGQGRDITVTVEIGDRRVSATIAQRDIEAMVSEQTEMVTVSERSGPSVTAGPRHWSILMEEQNG